MGDITVNLSNMLSTVIFTELDLSNVYPSNVS